MRYLAKITYDGSLFNGFQRLKNSRTVQGELEDKLSIIAKEKVMVKGAGRTDAHVHALGQYIHFDLDRDFEEEKLKNILNKLLSDDLKIELIKKVNNQFHARLWATGKWYRYKIKIGEYDPFLSRYVYQINYQLDEKKMIEVSKLFIGEHDFHNFTAGYRDNYVGNIWDIKISKDNNYIIMDFYGKGFYRYMVRNLVGSLIMVGRNKYSKKNIVDMLKSEINHQAVTAPAYGLYLMDVYYEKK